MATYYWVSRGTGFSTRFNDAGNWSLTSGGTGGAGFPTASDDAIIDGNSFIISTLTDVTVAVDNSFVANLTFSGITLPIRFVISSAITISGNLFIQNTNITRDGNGTLRFDGSGSHTFNFGSQTYSSIFFEGTGTYTLQSNYTQQAGSFFFTHTNGTLDLNGFTITCSVFNCNLTNNRTLNQNGGTINVTGNATSVVNITNTGFSYSGTRPSINLTYSGSTGTRTVNFDAASISQAVDINVTAGSDIFAIGASDNLYNLNFTGFSGTWTNSIRIIFGNLTISSGMTINSGNRSTSFNGTSTQLITSAGKTFDFPITQNGIGGTVELQDNLTLGSTRTYTLAAGTLDLSNGNRTLTCNIFSSTNSNIRSIAFGTGNITLTGSSATIFSMNNANNFSYSGTPTINCTYSGSIGTRTINGGVSGSTEAGALSFYISNGSDIVTTSNSAKYKNLDFTGFGGTLTNTARLIYGNLTFSSGMTLSSGTSAISFLATSGTQEFISNGQTLDFPVTQNGIGGTVELQDDLILTSTRTLTLTNGTFNANNFNVTTGLFVSNNSNTRTIIMGIGTWTITGTGTAWNLGTVTGLTFNSGSSTINMTNGTSQSFSGGGLTYYKLNQGGLALTIFGVNTFYDISNTVQPTTITFPASATTTFNNFSLAGTIGNLVTINSSTAGTQATLLYTP
jgi:hypothetical protein